MARTRPGCVRLACRTAPALLCLAAGCERRESIVRIDSEREANRILVVLHEQEIGSARKSARAEQRRTLWDISTAGADAARARKVLVERDLPRESAGGFDGMLADTGLIPTRTDEQARLVHALCGELERTLETVEGVVEARVHLVLPQRDALGLAARGEGAAPGARATVLIKYGLVDPRPKEERSENPNPPIDASKGHGEQRPPIDEASVGTLVAGAVEGLEPGAVKVVYTGVWISDAEPAPGPKIDVRHKVLAGSTLGFATALVVCVWLLARAYRSPREAPEA